MTELHQTPLYSRHQDLGARIVDFGGWALPVNYGSQVDEHHAVRQQCGMFDVSHMTVSDVTGADTIRYLQHLLANDIGKLEGQTGKAMYSCMLNEHGGVIDDLIVYRLSAEHCRLVTNATTNEKVIGWMTRQAEPFDVAFNERPELALLAVQGPQAIQRCAETLTGTGLTELAATATQLKRFQGAFAGEQFVGRTGYTGEDGLEFIVSTDVAGKLWDKLLGADVQPCGLGARDTLRLEAGMSLYGNDLDERHTPYESGLAWTVSKRDDHLFVGKQALTAKPRFTMIGLILQDRGVLRGHQAVLLGDDPIGETTSGTFSPTLQQSIALARVEKDADLEIGDKLQITVRNKQLNAVVATHPFVKGGKATN